MSFKNQRGFSLAGSVVAAAIIGLVALAAVTVFDNMSRSQNWQTFRTEAENLTDEIRASLASAAACRQSLGAAVLINGRSTPIGAVKFDDGSVRFALNVPYGNGAVKIVSIAFNYTPGDAAAPAPANSGQGELVLTLGAPKSVLGPSTVARSISVQTAKDSATNALAGCNPLSKATDSIWRRSAGTPRAIYYSEGNVGIGVMNPSVLLHLAHPDTGLGGGIFLENTSSGQIFSISNRADGGNPKRLSLSDETNHAERLVITDSGRLGISKGNPAAELDVNGEIKVGNAGRACDGVHEGSIRYNSAVKNMEFCNGTDWRPMGAVPVKPVVSIHEQGNDPCPEGTSTHQFRVQVGNNNDDYQYTTMEYCVQEN
jgi:type II secretory pathway pseudopilin PulG